MDVNADSIKYYIEVVEIGNEIRYKCAKCGKLYKWKITLNRHLYYECGVPKRYCCFLCNAKFRRNADLQKHVLKVHNIEQRKKYK